MYLTPIIYPLTIIPEEHRWLFMLNPMHYLLEVFRAPVYQGQLPDGATLAVATTLAVTVFVMGWWLFLRQADEIAYRI
jgi:ABC-type polysaccharide/polyol phosphate export permease